MATDAEQILDDHYCDLTNLPDTIAEMGFSKQQMDFLIELFLFGIYRSEKTQKFYEQVWLNDGPEVALQHILMRVKEYAVEELEANDAWMREK